MSAFNVMALDADYNIVSLLRPTNVQWNRKYYEAGNFSIQIPIEQYSNTFKYIYTKDRPETGVIKQVNYVNKSGYSYIQLSGFFMEEELNRMIAYPIPTDTNIVSSPTWIMQTGNAEDVAIRFFNDFKEINFRIFNPQGMSVQHSSKLNMLSYGSKGRGKYSEHARNGEKLGDKLYWILRPSGMSYRILYDFTKAEYWSTGIFECWEGLDRTEDNKDGNNPIVFSTKYGNVKNPDILLSELTYHNVCMTKVEYSDLNQHRIWVYNTFDNKEPITMNSYDDSMVMFESALQPADYKDEGGRSDVFRDALMHEAQIELDNNCSKTMNVEFDAVDGSYKYREDFDLGDICSLNIEEIGFNADVRIIGCYEVMKSGVWTMNMEFGTPIMKK